MPCGARLSRRRPRCSSSTRSATRAAVGRRPGRAASARGRRGSASVAAARACTRDVLSSLHGGAMSMMFLRRVLGLSAAALLLGAAVTAAQVPRDIAEGLRKIGQIVDPACTAKLYRPLMPKNDFNTYWPPEAPAPVFTSPLYPGLTIARDQSFGPDPKDVLDIFTSDKGGGNRPVFIYVPGGAGNKIEQQAREANAFYDNIGRWAAKNGMVGVLVQRHPGTGNWDDGGRDLSLAVDWIRENESKYRSEGNRIFIAAHSAGTGPRGVYGGHPERWKNGVPEKSATYRSGTRVARAGGGGGRGGPGGAGAPGANAPGSTGGSSANMASNDGAIAGPSGQSAAGGGPGGGGRGRGGQQLTPEQIAERDNLPGF